MIGRAGAVVATLLLASALPALAGPLAQDLSATVDAGGAVILTLHGTHDADVVLSFAVTAGPEHGTLGAIGPVACTFPGGAADCTASVTYTPVASFSGTDAFTYTASDMSTSSAATATITVAARVPLLPSDALTEQNDVYMAIVAQVVTGATVDYGDGTDALLLVQDDGTALLDHVYTTEGTFTVTVTNPGGSAAATHVNVLLAGPADTNSATVLPGGNVTMRVGGTLVAVLDVSATNPVPVQIIGAVYQPDAAGFESGAPTLGAFDVRALGAHENDRLVLTLSYPADAPADAVPTLLYFDPGTNAFAPVRGSRRVPSSLVVDRTAHTVTVVLDGSSTPSLLALRGTRLAVADDRRPHVTVDGVLARCTFAVTVEDDGRLKRVAVGVDGKRTIKRTSRKRFRVRVPLHGLTAGRHVLAVLAVDRDGRQGAASVDFERSGRRCAIPDP